MRRSKSASRVAWRSADTRRSAVEQGRGLRQTTAVHGRDQGPRCHRARLEAHRRGRRGAHVSRGYAACQPRPHRSPRERAQQLPRRAHRGPFARDHRVLSPPRSPRTSRPLPARPSTTSLSAHLAAAARAFLHRVALTRLERPLPARSSTASLSRASCGRVPVVLLRRPSRRPAMLSPRPSLHRAAEGAQHETTPRADDQPDKRPA